MVCQALENECVSMTPANKGSSWWQWTLVNPGNAVEYSIAERTDRHPSSIRRVQLLHPFSLRIPQEITRPSDLICFQVSPPSAANTSISMTKLVIKLSNGTPVPALGFGAGTAWFNKAGNDSTKPLNQELIASMKSAIDVGYRHLDLAEVSAIRAEFS